MPVVDFKDKVHDGRSLLSEVFKLFCSLIDEQDDTLCNYKTLTCFLFVQKVLYQLTEKWSDMLLIFLHAIQERPCSEKGNLCLMSVLEAFLQQVDYHIKDMRASLFIEATHHQEVRLK